ncbi:unnamed protein product [Echinostoma caproni]|uniref:Ion_trans domain-containing protein n=1 Tax=Echinostoma caproni TaxID=27848 RepID=A0A183B425_9TREM|nr:unnamed protein product [Echinostoma caproni]
MGRKVISELERFTERIEAIAMDVLNLVSLKDNTPEKMICREMLTVPLRTFGDLSLIDLFARAKCNDLLSLPCCQRVLDERWHGVLIHLPNWARWSSRLIPLAGVIYLDYKARNELAAPTPGGCTGNRSIKTQATGRRTSSIVVEKMGTLGGMSSTPPSSCSVPLLAKRISRFPSLGQPQRPNHGRARSSDEQSVQTMSMIQTPEPITTIYDRVTIGPRLKMMGDMLRKDLVPLLIVFFIFIFSYGVWFQGLIYPNSFYETPAQRSNAKRRGYLKHEDQQRLNMVQSFGELFRRAFYSIFEVSIVLDEETCEGNVYCGSDTGFRAVIYFVLVLYTGIVNIILINLLIALFSNTVSRIDQKATSLWLAGRYKMVKEYSERTVLPPPLNIFCVLYEVAHCLHYYCHRWARKQRRVHKQHKPYPPIREQHDSDSSDTEQGISSAEKRRKQRESKAIRVRLRNTRYLQEVMGSRSLTGSDKWELDAVLKFILLQSFALQDRRQTLGNGNNLSGPLSMMSITPMHQEPGEPGRYHEIARSFTHVQQRLDQMELLLNRVMDRLEDMSERKTLRTTYTSSPTRSPIRLRMPQVQLTRTSSNASQEPIQIPTSKEIFEALERERRAPPKPSLLAVTGTDECLDQWSSLPRQTKKSRSLSFKE